MNIYDFTVKDGKMNDVPLSRFKGKVLLILNTATKCGFTPQYKALQEIYAKYHEKGLEILDFPSNQFLGQAPGTNDEIAEFCQVNFGVKFTQFAKVDVNGEHEEPLFAYLKKEAGPEIEDEDMPKFKKRLEELKQSLSGDNIRWNFTKFLVDREGKVIGRYSPTTKPHALEAKIAELLG